MINFNNPANSDIEFGKWPFENLNSFCYFWLHILLSEKTSFHIHQFYSYCTVDFGLSLSNLLPTLWGFGKLKAIPEKNIGRKAIEANEYQIP